MTTVKIPCPHCNRLCALDPSKLPNRPVAFNCPGCSGKIVVDPTRLGAMSPPVAPPAQPESAVAPPAEAPALEPAPAAPPPIENLELPPGATLPSGLLCGDGGRVADELRRALGAHGCTLKALGDLAELAGWPVEEVPPLLVVVTRTAGRPPLDLLRPLGNLGSTARRRTFVVLVADNLATLDGSQAFFYDVNLMLATRDVSSAAHVLYTALQHYRHLAGPFLEALDESATG